jgi:hypothetical protein
LGQREVELHGGELPDHRAKLWTRLLRAGSFRIICTALKFAGQLGLDLAPHFVKLRFGTSDVLQNFLHPLGAQDDVSEAAEE